MKLSFEKIDEATVNMQRKYGLSNSDLELSERDSKLLAKYEAEDSRLGCVGYKHVKVEREGITLSYNVIYVTTVDGTITPDEFREYCEICNLSSSPFVEDQNGEIETILELVDITLVGYDDYLPNSESAYYTTLNLNSSVVFVRCNFGGEFAGFNFCQCGCTFIDCSITDYRYEGEDCDPLKGWKDGNGRITRLSTEY